LCCGEHRTALRVNCCEFFLKKRCCIKREKKKERKKESHELCREANSESAYTAPGNFWEQEGTTSHSPRFKHSVHNGAVRPSRRRTAVDGVKRSGTEEKKTWSRVFTFLNGGRTDESLSLSRTVKKTTKQHKLQSVQAN